MKLSVLIALLVVMILGVVNGYSRARPGIAFGATRSSLGHVDLFRNHNHNAHTHTHHGPSSIRHNSGLKFRAFHGK